MKIKNLTFLQLSVQHNFSIAAPGASDSLVTRLEKVFNHTCRQMVDGRRGAIELQHKDVSRRLQVIILDNDPSYESFIKREIVR